MDNIRLQHRVEDLETALASIKKALEQVAQTDHSSITSLSFNDGFKSASKLSLDCANIYIDINLNK